MNITVEKITGVGLLREMNECTMRYEKKSKQTLQQAYSARHSTIRSQLFIIRLYNIKSFVAMHLRTHGAAGQLILTSSGRPDLGAKEGMDRESLVSQIWLMNAEHLIQIANARLCKKASKETQEVVSAIRDAMLDVDPALADHMRPRCLELGRCRELKPCGYFKSICNTHKQTRKYGD